MNLLSANQKSISLREQRRLFLAPVLIVAVISLPLWATSASFISSNWISILSGGVNSAVCTLSFAQTGCDGFASFAEANRSAWQVANPVTSNPVGQLVGDSALVSAPAVPCICQANVLGATINGVFYNTRDLLPLAATFISIFASFAFCWVLRRKAAVTNASTVKAVLCGWSLAAAFYGLAIYILNNTGGMGCGL